MSKTILITGASRGIGQACAIRLAAPGVKLALMASDTDRLAETKMKCEEKGAVAECFGFDMGDLDALKEQFDRLQSIYPKIDVLINNAGIWIEKPFMEGDMDAWEHALDVNLKAVMRLTRYVLEDMPDGGSIINIASTASRKTYAGGTNYCAAKFGLLGFAGSLFEDVRARGIKVCSILPGVVNTDMHSDDASFEHEQMIQPQDIAQTVEFVLSMPSNVCPTEITLSPQKFPKKAR